MKTGTRDHRNGTFTIENGQRPVRQTPTAARPSRTHPLCQAPADSAVVGSITV